MTERIDRYIRGELTPEEARALAQESLDSPSLFDELTDTALAKAALTPETLQIAKLVRFPRKARWVIGSMAAAAALLCIWLINLRSVPVRSLKPALELSADASQPVLLASGLEPAGAPVFRGPQPDSRAPAQAGSIVSMEDGLANINLGSLDGLAKGSELPVFRGDEAVGRLQVTTVFRDRARGRVVEGKHIQVKDQVRIAAADHFGALLEQVDARFNRGDSDGAASIAEQAVQWGESARVAPRALAILWNRLAVLYMLRGQYDGAEALLGRAVSAAPHTDLVYAQSMNNLGVLAELRGDRHKAEAIYSDALSAFAGEERRAVERNLARVRGLR
jgi:hypothetical protein